MKSSWPDLRQPLLRQQQDALNAQLAALFQDDSESLSEMRTRCETLLQTAQNTISRDFTLRFAELESTLCRVLTDVIRPIEQQVKMELSESGFRPGFIFLFSRRSSPLQHSPAVQ